MARSQCRRSLKRNRRAFSTVVATIFMVLAVLFLYFNVFMFIQNQNVKFQDALSQSQQLDADRNMEVGQITVLGTVQHNAYYDPNSKRLIDTDELVFSCIITNNGQLPVSLTRFWVLDSQNSLKTNSTTAAPLPILLKPGAQLNSVTITVIIPGSAVESGIVRFWFMTTRGNEIGAAAYMP